MDVKLSIIIPCYNTEATLAETLESVYQQNFENWEAIIVNDGSPDNLEAIAQEWVGKDSRFKYYKKENGGLGSARNFGLTKTNGDYILPVDSDNKVRPDFAQKAIDIMENHQNVGVVYGDAMNFGQKNGPWIIGPFDGLKMLYGNYIDACAVIRKSIFEDVGGYDEDMPYQGQEDWELWIRVMKSKSTFYYLKEITFDYRVEDDSMIRSYSTDMTKENIDYIKLKHSSLYAKEYFTLYYAYKSLKKQQDRTLLSRISSRIRRIFLSN